MVCGSLRPQQQVRSRANCLLLNNQEVAASDHAPRSKTVQQIAAAGAILAMSGSSPLYRPRTPADVPVPQLFKFQDSSKKGQITAGVHHQNLSNTAEVSCEILSDAAGVQRRPVNSATAVPVKP